MTIASVTINPAVQSNFAGSFFSKSDGYTQGDALDDPAVRYFLRRGIVSPSATQVMWGGLLVTATLPTAGYGVGSTNPQPDLGFILTPATSIAAGNAAGYLGVTVLNQSTAMFQSAQSRVPSAPASGNINWYPVGSNARIPLQITSAAFTAWSGGVIDPQTIYWDYTNLVLTNTASGSTIGPITSMNVIDLSSSSRTVNASTLATNGFLSWTEQGYVAIVEI